MPREKYLPDDKMLHNRDLLKYQNIISKNRYTNVFKLRFLNTQFKVRNNYNKIIK